MPVKYYWQLKVYRLARDRRQRCFEFSKEERQSLTDQLTRASRSVCSYIAGAWGRRPYRADFVNKLNVSESEARETQCWTECAVEYEYLAKEIGQVFISAL